MATIPANIEAALRAGKAVKEIATEAGVSAGTIRNYARHLGIVLHRNTINPEARAKGQKNAARAKRERALRKEADLRQDVLCFLADGNGIRAASERFHIASQTVSRWRNEAGLPPARPAPSALKSRWTPQLKAAAIATARSKNLKAAEREHHVSAKTVRQWMEEEINNLGADAADLYHTLVAGGISASIARGAIDDRLLTEEETALLPLFFKKGPV